jgi:hypothetical protein
MTSHTDHDVDDGESFEGMEDYYQTCPYSREIIDDDPVICSYCDQADCACYDWDESDDED